ncbi:MAG: 50S ribosomal protein L23 [Alphaproteobacteria bacterium]|nr:50S ribosomal protein L23 [Alphaproteobacteria bacterium]
MYDMLITPIITEKATLVSEKGQVVFEVDPRATKQVIKVAVEAIYGVKVEGVNISILKGKTKRFRGKSGKRKDMKKAYVRLAKGEKIDLTTA